MSAKNSLGAKATSGFAIVFLQSIATKVFNMIGQVILAWFLAPDDFGVIGLAYTVLNFVGLIQEAGISDILLRRNSKFARWATPAHYLVLFIGICCGLLLIIASPLIARFYSSPQITGLLWIFAVMIPINSATIVPVSQLHNNLNFRFVATQNIVMAILQTVASIVLAKVGAGSYSIALPMLAVAIIRAVGVTMAARVKINKNFGVKYWRYFIKDSITIFGVSFFTFLVWQGDYIILGRTHTQHEVGIYYFAFNLSLQTVMLLVGNAKAVILPVLNKLQHDPVKHLSGFLRIESILALVGIPLCFWQAAVADPLLRILFQPRWIEASPLLVILSIGMAFRITEWPSESFLKSQGRFKVLLNLAIVNAIVFVLTVSIASIIGGPIQVALAVSFCLCLFGPLRIYVAIYYVGGDWCHIRDIFLIPLSTAFFSFGFSYYVVNHVFDLWMSNGSKVSFVTIVGGIIYFSITLKLLRPTWDDFFDRLNSIIGKKSKLRIMDAL